MLDVIMAVELYIWCLFEFWTVVIYLLQLLEDSLENRLEKTGLISDSEKAEGENKEAEIDENKVHIFLNACNLIQCIPFSLATITN